MLNVEKSNSNSGIPKSATEIDKFEARLFKSIRILDIYCTPKS